MALPSSPTLHGAAPPSFDALERLAASPDIRDRGFVASVLAFHPDRSDRARVSVLYERIRGAARSQHAELRQRIADRTIDPPALLAQLREAPLEIRDHLVEEILDIAYPPLEQSALPADAIPYRPSGLAEILVALENAELGPGKTFVDLGAGLGKVVLLVALLTGARAYGIELDPTLVSQARSAARSLGLDNACFLEGDIRDAPLPPADVYYMYIPLTHSTAVVERLETIAAERSLLLFSQPLDLTRLPWLTPGAAASYWLAMYRGPERAAREPGLSRHERLA